MDNKLSLQDQSTEFLLYTAPNGEAKVEVLLSNETIWLTQERMAELFGVQRPAITKHLKNILESNELQEEVVCSILEHTTSHGAIEGKTQTQKVKYYNLDAVISVGYRVSSTRAIQFRIWATRTLKQHLVEYPEPAPFAGASDEFKQAGNGNNSPPLEGCPKGGVVTMRKTKAYKSLPYNPDLKDRAKALRKAGILHEALLWLQLKSKKLNGLDFDRQKIIGNYIVDFYCAEKSVVIEVDGSSHDSKQLEDAQRDDYLNSLGLTVIRLLAKDVLQNMEGVVVFLKNHPALTGTPPEEGNTLERKVQK